MALKKDRGVWRHCDGMFVLGLVINRNSMMQRAQVNETRPLVTVWSWGGLQPAEHPGSPLDQHVQGTGPIYIP